MPRLCVVRESDARSWGEQQECNPYTIGHQCTGGDPYAEDGSDTAAMNYQGGYDSGFAAVRMRAPCANSFVLSCNQWPLLFWCFAAPGGVHRSIRLSACMVAHRLAHRCNVQGRRGLCLGGLTERVVCAGYDLGHGHGVEDGELSICEARGDRFRVNCIMPVVSRVGLRRVAQSECNEIRVVERGPSTAPDQALPSPPPLTCVLPRRTVPVGQSLGSRGRAAGISSRGQCFADFAAGPLLGNQSQSCSPLPLQRLGRCQKQDSGMCAPCAYASPHNLL
eukprot:3171070-Rhodomonas_salina.2